MLLHLLFACSGGEVKITSLPVLEGARPDVVVVTLDTTRADRLGVYGYELAQTQTIDRLAREGVRFDNAYSPLPLTIPAHATMFTGLLPYHHGIRNNGDGVLAPEFTTLAEILQQEGWATAASVAAFVTTRQWGFAQGFDAYFDSIGTELDPRKRNYWHNERSGNQVVDDALNWLAGQRTDQPVFLWVHLYDPHYPYVAKGAYAETMKDRAYDAELAYVDDQIARLVEAFQGRNVLWSLIGDHGESLGEHDEGTHGIFTYNATQHVPWILSGAGLSAGVVPEAVSTADLTPTLLRLLSIPIPDGLDGKPQPGSPVAPYAESYSLSDRFRLAPHRAIVEGNLKLIATPKPELYDLADDPGELHNLAATRPDDVERLLATLEALGATPPGANKASMDADTLSQLAALGYMTGGGGDDVDPLTLPDPKDFRKLIAGVSSLEHGGGGGGEPENMLAQLDALLALKPDAFELRMRRLTLLAKLNRMEEGRLFAEETAEMFPGRSRVWLTLATMARQERDFVQSLAYARKAVEAEPNEPAAREAAVEALFALDRTEDAIADATAAMAADPKNYGVAALLGQHYLGKNEFQSAERYLRIAVDGPTPRRASRAQLALLALGAGARGDAYSLLEAEVRDYPGNQKARRALSRLLGEDQNWLDQREHVAFMARANPGNPDDLRALAQCLFNLADYDAARVTIDAALFEAPENPDILLLNANLLAKEGKWDEGLAMRAAANAAHEKRIQARAAPDGNAGVAPAGSRAGGTPAASDK